MAVGHRCMHTQCMHTSGGGCSPAHVRHKLTQCLLPCRCSHVSPYSLREDWEPCIFYALSRDTHGSTFEKQMPRNMRVLSPCSTSPVWFCMVDMSFIYKWVLKTLVLTCTWFLLIGNVLFVWASNSSSTIMLSSHPSIWLEYSSYL